MPARKVSTKAQHGKIARAALAYAWQQLTLSHNGPFSKMVVQTIMQEAWKAGYEAALRDVRKGGRAP